MSNRDGRGAKRRDSLAEPKAGDKCPSCTKLAKKQKRTLKLDSEGHALPVNDKGTRLEKADCHGKRGHEHHVHCPACNWTNF